jgi:hypothetical protein
LEGQKGYLEGIDNKTTKAELLDRLKSLADKLHAGDGGTTTRLAEVEKRVRAKRSGTDHDLRTVMITASPAEWREVEDFLDDFEDLLPVGLARIHEGSRQVKRDTDKKGATT